MSLIFVYFISLHLYLQSPVGPIRPIGPFFSAEADSTLRGVKAQGVNQIHQLHAAHLISWLTLYASPRTPYTASWGGRTSTVAIHAEENAQGNSPSVIPSQGIFHTWPYGPYGPNGPRKKKKSTQVGVAAGVLFLTICNK